MAYLELAIVAVFLPLFPLSMLVSLLFDRLRHPLPRGLLLAGWPLAGLALADQLDIVISDSQKSVLLIWALATAALYAFRMLTLRELERWTAFLGISLWALLWLPLVRGDGLTLLSLEAIGFSTPLVLLIILAGLLTQRFGAAYTGLYNGIGLSLPRLSIVLVISVLAAIGTPAFPTFFSMLSFLLLASPAMIVALLLIWLLWSWAGTRMIQGFVVGESPQQHEAGDINLPVTLLFLVVFIAMLITGGGLSGALL